MRSAAGTGWFFVERGEEMVMTEEVTAFKENELFAFKLENDVMFVDAQVTFAETDGQTGITATHVVRGRNAFWRSLLPLFKSSIERRGEENFAKLKAVIEAAEPAQPATGDGS